MLNSSKEIKVYISRGTLIHAPSDTVTPLPPTCHRAHVDKNVSLVILKLYSQTGAKGSMNVFLSFYMKLI